MTEMMLRLPVVEIATTADVWEAKLYERSGRYIIRRDNGDVSVADVQIKDAAKGEARPIDERCQNVFETFVGQPELLDPAEWVLKTEMESKRRSYESQLKTMEDCIDNEREEHEAAMAEQKQTALDMVQAAKDAASLQIKEMQTAIDERTQQLEKEYEAKRTALEHEYEMKRLQLEMEVPKRFAQGEWVSGKTLTEIIKTLAGKSKED